MLNLWEEKVRRQQPQTTVSGWHLKCFKMGLLEVKDRLDKGTKQAGFEIEGLLSYLLTECLGLGSTSCFLEFSLGPQLGGEGHE